MITAGYDGKGEFFVTVGKNENGKGLTGMMYCMCYYEKATGTIVMAKKRRIGMVNSITYRNLNSPAPSQAEVEGPKLEYI